MAEVQVAPTYTYAQLTNIINNEASSCASNRKAGLKNLFTSKGSLFDDCKNGLVNWKYKYDLEEALEYENAKTASLDNATLSNIGMSKQTMGIVVLAILVFAAIAILYK